MKTIRSTIMNSNQTILTHLRRFTLFLAFTFVCTSAGAVNYVTPTGAGNHSGTSWANAMTLSEAANLQPGIDALALHDIWLQAGVHVPNGSSSIYASIYGGFNGTETTLSERDPIANVSIIQGSQLVVDNSNRTYDGFTLRNAGFYGIKTATIRDCIFDNVRMQLESNSSGTRNFIDCVFKNTSGNWSAVYVPNATTAIFTRCVFENNHCTQGNGGAVEITDASISFFECRFENNSTVGSGGAVYMNDPTQTKVINCLFSGNSAGNGGAIYARITDAGVHRFSLNTFVNNSGSGGSAFRLDRDGTGVYVFNNIAWGNTGSAQFHCNNINAIYGQVPYSYNLVENNSYGGGGANIQNAVSGDPLFNTDYSLKSCSPAINAGRATINVPGYGNQNATEGRTTDLAGDPRLNGHPDLGCYEYQGTPFTASITADVTNICTGVATISASSGSSYLWSNGATTSSIQVGVAEVGDYSCDITSTDGCTVTSNSITISSVVPTGTISGLLTNYCTSAAPVTLSGTPAGGTFSGPGISGNNFSALAAGSGIHTVQYDYTVDGCTGSTTLTTTVIVDEEAPVLSCPANVTGWNAPGSAGGVYNISTGSASLQCEPGTCGATVNYVTPTATDNCGNVSVVRTSGLASASLFPKGTTTITYVATDGAGLTSTCTFDVTIIDLEVTPIVCPNDIIVSTEAGLCSAQVSYTPPVGTDNCPGATTALIAGQGPDTLFDIGSHTETYEVTDASGNSNSCSFTITVEDNENPNIVCPSDTAVNIASGSCYITVNYDAPIGLDNCTGATTTLLSGLGDGGSFPVGDNLEIYQATDVAGNTGSCSFTVTVTNTPPAIASVTPLNGPTTGGYTLTILGTNFDANANVRIGNQLCSGVVATPSGITCIVPEGTGTNLPVVVTNGSLSSQSVAFSYHAPQITSLSGCVDQGNSTFDCSMAGGQTITVMGTNLFNPTHVFVGAGEGTSVISDATTPHSKLSFTLPQGSGAKTVRVATASGTSNGVDLTYVHCPAGTILNGFECTDCLAGTYSPAEDCAVCLTCPPGSFSDESSATGCTTCPPGYYQPDAGSTECLPCPLGKYNPSTGQTECLPCAAGTYNDELAAVSCQACEAGTSNGIEGAIACVDCAPGYFTANSGSVTCSVCPPGSFSDTNAATGCTTCPAGYYQPNPGSNECLPCPLGKYNPSTGQTECLPCAAGTFNDELAAVSCQACEAGSSSSSEGAIACVACAPGSFTADAGSTTCSDCPPGSFTNATSATGCSTCPPGYYQPNAGSSECIPCELGYYNPSSGQTECLPCAAGSFSNTTAATSCQNCEAGSFAPGPIAGIPNISCQVCPEGTYQTATGQSNCLTCPTGFAYAGATQTICGNSSATLTAFGGVSYAWVGGPNTASYTVSPSETTTYTVEVTDANGCTETASVEVVVTDDGAPSISCPSDISVVTFPASCQAAVSYQAPVATDDCSEVTLELTQGPASGSTFILGTTTVVFEATDASGNSASCQFNVTVIDRSAPTVVCPPNLTAVATPGLCGAVVNFDEPSISDNCTVADVQHVAGLPSGSVFNIGTMLETYTATDESGNSASCSFLVTVTDNEAPALSCPGNIVVENEAGTCSATVSAAATASDNCAFTLTNSFNGTDDASGSYQVGTTSVSYYAVDSQGNSTSCTFIVTVNDTEGPSLGSCPDDIAGCDGTGISWTAPTADDNCGVSCFFSNYNPGDNFQAGVNTVAYEVEDANGNQASCSFTVTIYDAPAVTISEDLLPAFCQGPTMLTAHAEGNVSYAWSTGETTASIELGGAGTYTVTVTDENGCVGNTSYENNSVASETLSSYTIIGLKEVAMERNTVYSGGVGVTGPNRTAEIDDNSTITASGTFVKAANVDVSGGSVVSDQITGEAIVALPAYQGNPYNVSNDVTVNQGQTATLSLNSYDKVRVKKNATAIFPNAQVFINELKVEDGAEVIFLQCADVMIKSQLEFKKGVVVNTSGYKVVIYSGGDVKVGGECQITASIYAPLNKIELSAGKGNNHTTMIGTFIAYEIEAERYVDWYASTSCGPCASSSARLPNAEEAETIDRTPESPMQLNAYPNPFRDEVNIDFIIPEATTAHVELITSDGTPVRVLFEGEVGAWELNRVQVQSESLASGVYFYRITTGNGKSEVRKLILSR